MKGVIRNSGVVVVVLDIGAKMVPKQKKHLQ